MLAKLKNITDKVKSQKGFYLATFGSFVKSDIVRIMLAREKSLFTHRNFGDKIRDEFQEKCMDFMIENPEYFASKIEFPYIKTLISIKLIKESPEKYNIIWINDDTFIEAPNTMELGKTVKINSLINPYYPAKDKEPFIKQFSEKDIAYAMMNAFDYKSLTVKDEWFQIMLERDEQKKERREQWKDIITKSFTPRVLSKSLLTDNPLDTSPDTNDSLTLKRWKQHVRYMIKMIFTELNIFDYKTALEHYSDISRTFLYFNHKAGSSAITIKHSKISRAISAAEAWLMKSQKGKKSRSHLREDEIREAIIKGITSQLTDVTRKNRAYGFAYTHVDNCMKRFKCMKFSAEALSYLETALFQEAVICRYEYSNQKTFILDIVIQLKLLNANETSIINLIKSLLLKPNFFETTSNKKLNQKDLDNGFSKLSSFYNESINTNPVAIANKIPFNTNSIGTHNDTLLNKTAVKLLTFIKSLNQSASHALNQALKAPISDSYSRNIHSHLIEKLQFRLVTINADVNKSCKKTDSYLNKPLLTNQQPFNYTRSQNNIFLLFDILEDTILTPYLSLDTKTKTYNKIKDNLSIYFNSQYSHHNISLSNAFLKTLFAAINFKNADIIHLLLDNPACKLTRANQETYEISCATDKIEDNTLKYDTIMKLISLYKSYYDIPHSLIESLPFALDVAVKKIEPHHKNALPNLLLLYFNEYNIEPYSLLITCPDWQKPTIFELLSQ
jgi:hypothetical protein